MFLLAFGCLLGIVYFMYRFLMNVQPNTNRVVEDLRGMKEDMKDTVAQLVPLSKEELELLSFNQINNAVKKGMVTTMKGVFTSIYHEPLVAYSYKKYYGKGHNAVLYARTASQEFIYRIQNKGIHIKADGKLLGVLMHNGLLYDGQTKKLMGRINKEDNLSLPVVVADKQVASIQRPEPMSAPNPRAFEFVSNMTPKEETVFLSLSILEMVEHSLPSKN